MKLKSLKMLIKNEDGAVLIIVALMMTVLMGFAALAIDVGFMYNQRRSLQNAADAGALAGVLEIGLSGDYEGAAITAVQKNIGIPEENIEVTLVSPKRVRVDVEQVASKRFSVFLTSGTSMVGASATAEKIQWAGEALPFLNQNPYVGEFGVWEKLGENPGSFEGIVKDEWDPPIYLSGSKTDLSKGVVFDIKYEDGIAVGQGAMSGVKDEVGAIFSTKLAANQTVYVLSIRDDIIKADSVMLTDKSYVTITGTGPGSLKNGGTVDLSQLVLLECKFLDYKNKWDTGLFELVNVYNIGAGVYPPNYIEPEGRAARLIN